MGAVFLMGIASAAFRNRCTIHRRAVSNDPLTPRGAFAPVAGLTSLPAGYRTLTLRREAQGNMPVAGVEGEIMLRLSAAAETITVADVAILDGVKMQILSIDLPDRLNGVLRLQVKRNPGIG